MIKLFGPKIVDRVTIQNISDKKIYTELNQAKGVMNNFLKDKKFKITISDSVFWGKDSLDIKGFSDSAKSMNMYSIKTNSETHFLRNVYKVIENLAKSSINEK